MSLYRIWTIDEYKLYLEKHLKDYVKNERKRKILIEELMLVFIDGIRFNQGKLEVEI